MKILITGGTGTLGKALVSKLHKDHDITVLSRDPVKQINMSRIYPHVNFVLGDVRDLNSLHLAFSGQDVVIHAAAQKHIPQGEFNPQDCIDINVTGSINVASASLLANVKRVVGISTDKACHPQNVYGATKMMMERIFLSYAGLTSTTFHLCRYGNVIGSAGSVVPIWQNALYRGEKPKLTDPNMTRFWLSVDEAVDLVLYSLDHPGIIVIPKADASNMLDFAKRILGDDVELEIIGSRPGEKMHEVLFTDYESHFVVDAGDYYHLDLGNPTGERLGEYASNNPTDL